MSKRCPSRMFYFGPKLSTDETAIFKELIKTVIQTIAGPLSAIGIMKQMLRLRDQK